jgi:hypothetical protein
MKALIIFLISFNLYAQNAPQGNAVGGTVDTENPSNYKSPLIKEIVSIPVQKADNKTLMSWDKSLFQVGYGQSYFRMNPFDENNNSVSTFTDGGYDLNLRAQYYLFSFFSLLIDYEFTTFQAERFDGQSIEQSNRIARSLGYGLQFDLGDFIIGFLLNSWNKPFYDYDGSQLNEDEYQADVYSYKLGHRTGVKNVIIELFYFYHDFQSFEVARLGETTGRLQTLGVEIFLNTKKTFGLHFAESFGTLDSENGYLEIKQFKLQPFFRF